jgi:hypothetical protein
MRTNGAMYSTLNKPLLLRNKFREYPSLLKNPFALTSAPGLGAEYAVSVAFWARFRALLDRRPGRTYFFNRLTPSTHSAE